MSLDEYLTLMSFPREWQKWNMLPDMEYMSRLISSYQSGMENSSEHDRNGCFHYWLKQDPQDSKLALLVKLARLDPDQFVGMDAISYIQKSKNYGLESQNVISNIKDGF